MTVVGKSLTLGLTGSTLAYERLFEWVLPAHIIDPATFIDDWNDRLWPSAGPFTWVSTDLVETGGPSTVVLERNPTYWERDPATGEPLPYLDEVEVIAYPLGPTEPDEVLSSFLDMQFDALVGEIIAPDWTPLTAQVPESGAAADLEFDLLFEVMLFNLDEGRFTINPDSLNDQLAFRQAVLAATNLSSIGESMRYLPVSSILGTAIDHYDHDAWAIYDDPAAVPSLLAEVDGSPSLVYVSSSGDETVRIGDVVVDRLNDAGIEAVTSFDGDYFGEQLPNGLLDVYSLRAFGASGAGLSGVADALSFFDPLGERLVYPLARWGPLTEEAQRYHDIVTEAQGALDHERVVELIREAEQILSDNAVVYPLVRQQGRLRTWWPDRIQGIEANRYSGWDTWNAAVWWSPDA